MYSNSPSMPLPTTSRSWRTHAYPRAVRRTQPRRAGRHGVHQHPISRESRRQRRHPGADRRGRAPRGRLPLRGGGRRAAAVGSPPVRPCASGRCPAATRTRCSTMPGELGVERVGLEAAHVTLARYEWLVANAASRRLRLTVPLDQRARRDGAHGEGRGRDRRCCARPRRGWIDRGRRRAVRAARAGVAERTVAVAIEAAIAGAGLRAARLRHHRRLRPECGVAASPSRRSCAGERRPRRARLRRRAGRILL